VCNSGWNQAYRLKNRTLAGGLITTDYNLWQLDDATKTLTTEVIDDVKDLALLITLQRFKTVGRNAIRINSREWLGKSGAVAVYRTGRHFMKVSKDLEETSGDSGIDGMNSVGSRW
jgi:hypothetical protein